MKGTFRQYNPHRFTGEDKQMKVGGVANDSRAKPSRQWMWTEDRIATAGIGL
jgi:hypothetical protein